jgi:hypothetical protein
MVNMPFVPFVFPFSTALGNSITVPADSDLLTTNSNITEKTGQKIAKETIYKQANPTPDIKRLFVQQVEQIIWRYKLSPETLNLAASDAIAEVQVFDLVLKAECTELNIQVLSTLDKTIPTAICFRLLYTNARHVKMQFAMADKRVNKRDNEQMVVRDYFFSPKISVKFNPDFCLPYINQSQKLPVVLNMESLHQALLRSLLAKPALENETLDDQLSRIASLKVLTNKLATTQAAICKEKQFNRKIELNHTLNQIKQKMQTLGE